MEKFTNYNKKEMLAYEKENNIKLFSVVNDETRYGKTAFFVQAPSEGCYNRNQQDCNRKNGETQKRVEVHYKKFRGNDYWFHVSVKLDDWAINRYGMITQSSSDKTQPMLMLRPITIKVYIWSMLVQMAFSL